MPDATKPRRMNDEAPMIEATCVECGTTWELGEDQPMCPFCLATSYTVPRYQVLEATTPRPEGRGADD
jgi:rubrerythrin